PAPPPSPTRRSSDLCRAAIRQGFLERRLANDLVGRLEGFARPLVPHQYAIVQLIGDEQLAVRHRHAPRIIQRARARLRVLAAIRSEEHTSELQSREN